MLSKFSIKTRLISLATLPLILLTLILLLVTASQIKKMQSESVRSAEEILTESKREELKHIIDMAYSAIAPLYEGGGSRDDAVAILQNMSFGEDGYIFGYTEDAVRVFSGNSQANIGESYYDFQDTNGVYLIRDLIAAGKKNATGESSEFVGYHFPRLGGDIAYPKLSYAIFLDEWNLMIGTGIYIDHIKQQVSTLEAIISESSEHLLMLVFIVALIALLVFTSMGLMISRSILRPLDEATQSIFSLSQGEGDLTQRLDVSDEHEMGALATQTNALLSTLQTLIQKVKQVAHSVSEQGHTLTDQANNINQLSAAQHTEIDQIASATTQMSESASQAAHNASNAARAARNAEQESHAALASVERTRGEMHNLTDALARTSDVVSHVGADVENISVVLQVIENIAEQTNLLALNAAIEAARAGEQGRGFAVVADEVRTLASRTQGSTEEIQQMIDKLQKGARNAANVMADSIKNSENTSAGIDATAANLNAISQAVNTLSDENTQIATAAEQQRVVSGDISGRIAGVAGQTTELAGISTQNARVANELEDKVRELEGLIGQFRV